MIALRLILAAFVFCLVWAQVDYKILTPDQYPDPDYYRVLGVRRQAEEEEIREVFRDHCRKIHPDVVSDWNPFKNFFYRINDAFSVLIHPEKSKAYARGGEAALHTKYGPRFVDPLKDPNQLDSKFESGTFYMHFGFREGEEKRSPNMGTKFPVTLDMINTGSNLTIMIERNLLCPKCGGTGAASPKDLKTCPICNGERMVQRGSSLGSGFSQTAKDQCKACDGLGKLAQKPCEECQGKKVYMAKTEKSFYLAPGTPDGYQFTFEKEAEQVPDAVAGDVVIQIETEEHKNFTRDPGQQADLVIKRNITLMEALLGFDMEVYTLDGRAINFTKTDITHPGGKYVIEGEGLPVFLHPDGIRGNLVVELNIVFPEKVHNKQRQKLKKKKEEEMRRRAEEEDDEDDEDDENDDDKESEGKDDDSAEEDVEDELGGGADDEGEDDE